MEHTPRQAHRKYTYVVLACGEQYAHDEQVRFAGKDVKVTHNELWVDGLLVANLEPSGWYLTNDANIAGARSPYRKGRINYCVQERVPFWYLNPDATFEEMGLRRDK